MSASNNNGTLSGNNHIFLLYTTIPLHLFISIPVQRSGLSIQYPLPKCLIFYIVGPSSIPVMNVGCITSPKRTRSKNIMIIPALGTTVVEAIVAIFAYRRAREDHILQEQNRAIKDAAARLSVRHTPTILVLGFQKHGKSSFVNTVFRVLYREEGPLLLRAQTSPSKLQRGTTVQRVFRVKNKISRYPKYLLNLRDTPGLDITDAIDDKAIRAVLRGQSGQDNADSDAMLSIRKNVQSAPECVIVVLKSYETCEGGPAWAKLPELARIIREEGLQFVVVLTYKKHAKKTADIEELTRNVALRAGTDCVHCIENYIPDIRDGHEGAIVKNDFETHNKTLNIVRHCIEYARQHRQQLQQTLKRSASLSAVDELQGSYESSASE